MKPDAILTADWHLRETLPVCRVDSERYFEKQWEKVAFVHGLQKKYDCPVLHAGDLFDYWKPSPDLLSKTLESIPENLHTVYGNHDLPRKNLAEKRRSGVFTLYCAGFLGILNVLHWGQEPKTLEAHKIASIKIKDRYILVNHVMTYTGKEPYPGCPNPAERFLQHVTDTYEYDLVLTGHNHKSFVVEHGDYLLVNPGSLMRMSVTDLHHQPSVYLWYADTNSVERVYIPIEKDVISNEHIELKEREDRWLNAYIEKLNTEFSDGLKIDYNGNMEVFIAQNEIRKPVENAIWEALDSQKC